MLSSILLGESPDCLADEHQLTDDGPLLFVISEKLRLTNTTQKLANFAASQYDVQDSRLIRRHKLSQSEREYSCVESSFRSAQLLTFQLDQPVCP